MAQWLTKLSTVPADILDVAAEMEYELGTKHRLEGTYRRLYMVWGGPIRDILQI